VTPSCVTEGGDGGGRLSLRRHHEPRRRLREEGAVAGPEESVHRDLVPGRGESGADTRHCPAESGPGQRGGQAHHQPAYRSVYRMDQVSINLCYPPQKKENCIPIFL
jgi:hypothetical protein